MRFLLIPFLTLIAGAQTGTLIDLGNQGRNADFSAFPYTRTVAFTLSLPATCAVGQQFWLVNSTTLPTTGTLYSCTTPNTWTQAGGGSTNATSLLGIPITGTPTNNFTLVYNSGSNQWQIVAQSGATYTNGTGILLGGSTFSLDTSYLNTNYFNNTIVNTVTQQSTPVSPPSAGFVKIYAKTGTNQICTFNSSSVEACSSTGTSSPGGAFNSIGYNAAGSFGGVLNSNITKGYFYQTNSGVPAFQLLPIPNTDLSPIDLSTPSTNGGIVNRLGIANGGTNGATANAGFFNLSPMTSIGDLITLAGGSTPARVAGNITTTPLALISTGNGASANAPAFGPFVSTVNGQSGAVTVATGNYQTIKLGGTAITNRAIENLTGSGGITITNTDNGVDTQTLNINASGTTPSFASGSGAPSSTCGSTQVGNGYQQTGSNSRTWLCGNVNGTFRWILISDHSVNFQSFAPVADGVTDDSAALRNAITFAKTTFNYSGDFWASDIFIPCGRYGIGSPVVLPRSGNFSYGSGSGGGPNGVVNLIGESPGCVAFVGLAGFPNDVNAIYVTSQGNGAYTTPTATLSGCSANGTLTPVIVNGYVTSVFMNSAPTGCSGAMPTCTISATGGAGGACQAVGRSIIEWADATLVSGVATNARVVGQTIKNISFSSPPVVGDMSIHYRQTLIDGGAATTNERIAGGDFENLIFYGSNAFNPLDIYIGAECIGCSFYNISDQNLTATNIYETVLVGTGLWYDGQLADEGSGCNFGCVLDGLSSGASRGGVGAVFQGRLNQSILRNASCDGLWGGRANSQCYAFNNSVNNNLIQLVSAGGADNPQILFINSNQNNISQISTGPALAVGKVCPGGTCTGGGNAISLFNSDENTFTAHTAIPTAASYSARGVKSLFTDAASFNNQFLDWQVNGVLELSISDSTTNFVQYCDSTTTACSGGGFYSTFGFIVGKSLTGNGTQPTCNANTRGAIWPVKGTPDVLQECGATGWVNYTSGGGGANGTLYNPGPIIIATSATPGAVIQPLTTMATPGANGLASPAQFNFSFQLIQKDPGVGCSGGQAAGSVSVQLSYKDGGTLHSFSIPNLGMETGQGMFTSTLNLITSGVVLPAQQAFSVPKTFSAAASVPIQYSVSMATPTAGCSTQPNIDIIPVLVTF